MPKPGMTTLFLASGMPGLDRPSKHLVTDESDTLERVHVTRLTIEIHDHGAIFNGNALTGKKVPQVRRSQLSESDPQQRWLRIAI